VSIIGRRLGIGEIGNEIINPAGIDDNSPITGNPAGIYDNSPVTGNPAGIYDNSPAIYCRVEGSPSFFKSPVGTAAGSNSAVPTGLKTMMWSRFPAINCRAIIGCPFGTEIR